MSNAKGCSNYHTIALISHASKIMFKILQVRLQKYVNLELPDVLAGFRKGRGIRDQIVNTLWVIEKAKEIQENFCFIDYSKAFDCVDHKKLCKILKEMDIPDHLRNLYAVQEATVRIRHGTRDWLKTGKGGHQSSILSPCLFNLGSQGNLSLHRTPWPVSCRDLTVPSVDDQDFQVGSSYHKPLPLVSPWSHLFFSLLA